MNAVTPLKAAATVTPDGASLKPRIDGVRIHRAVTHEDDRGTLCEIYGAAWGFDDLPLVHAYLVTVRPGMVKGWAIHEEQVDRYFFVSGCSKLVLYDGRPHSPTHRLVTEDCFSEASRALVLVPPGVFHAVENIGQADSLLFNIPSRPYRHEDPDKHTLPLANDLIPYSFDKPRGY
jgi:dTDP-4-dehydrorhamnose 3,5-epimerase